MKILMVCLGNICRSPLAEGIMKEKIKKAIFEGVVFRFRPKLMTVFAILGGLLPIMFVNGVGSEVMQRIAAPMIGGVVSSAILTLLVIPVLYYMTMKPHD